MPIWLCDEWKWLGINAGQIQIIIAVIAFVLACVVYKKVLEQIKISIKQTDHAAEQSEQAIQQTKEMVEQTKISNERSQTAIEQRELAVEQNNFLLQQRTSEMKFNIINLIDKNVDSNCQMLIQFPSLLKKFELTSNALRVKGDEAHKILDNHIETFQRHKLIIEGTKNKLVNLSKNIANKNESSDLDYLEEQLRVLSETLVSSTNSKYDYILILDHLEEVRKTSGLTNNNY